MKLFLYIIRWQMSTPVLFLVIKFLPFGDLTKTIIANLIGAMLFYQLDKLIFKKGEK